MKKVFFLLVLISAQGTAFAEGAAPERWANAFTPPIEWLLVVVGVSLLVAFLVVSSMKAKLKTAAHRQQADSYMRKDSLSLDKTTDLFLYETVERKQRQSSEKKKQTKGRFGGNRTEDDNVITSGSVIAVNEGQCMMIVDQGKIVEFCAEPGEYTFDANAEPSIFSGDGGILDTVLQSTYERFAFGGQAGKDQRVYFFNTKEIIGNRYGTPSPIPSRKSILLISMQSDLNDIAFVVKKRSA